MVEYIKLPDGVEYPFRYAYLAYKRSKDMVKRKLKELQAEGLDEVDELDALEISAWCGFTVGCEVAKGDRFPFQLSEMAGIIDQDPSLIEQVRVAMEHGMAEFQSANGSIPEKNGKRGKAKA